MNKASDERGVRIRQLNDEFRSSLAGGAVVVTAGIVALGARQEHAILEQVRSFKSFTPDNDPHGEHDFGSFKFGGSRIIFKIDYFDVDRAMHSPNAADPDVTERVLTIMLAREW